MYSYDTMAYTFHYGNHLDFMLPHESSKTVLWLICCSLRLPFHLPKKRKSVSSNIELLLGCTAGMTQPEV